ncbi:hypothetical protein VB776_16320 [Arcicella sp. DC2W]|uniref:ImmA/IrrE family metallo-endopeptidase n=1 Tax=Arcicella gelida TaxID=2984195 RepID=A0ABU5S7V5_9BACT|nr:hypothetical protein [Arcicella sp. DC2W]MEA5404499.1 hypothetical protein [Arcicella sp. DC2W]
MKGIKQIVVIDDIPDTPACVYPATGIMEISAKHFENMPPEYRFFILLHEYFHVIADTKIEELADYYAFQEYAKRGYSLKALINCISDILNLSLFESHRERAVRLLILAQQYDKANTKNGN